MATRPHRIRARLRRQPFLPIRVFVSDGSYYDVRHPGLMVVNRTAVVIGLGLGDDQLPETLTDIDPVHITHIEPIDGKRARAKKRSGK